VTDSVKLVKKRLVFKLGNMRVRVGKKYFFLFLKNQKCAKLISQKLFLFAEIFLISKILVEKSNKLQKFFIKTKYFQTFFKKLYF